MKKTIRVLSILLTLLMLVSCTTGMEISAGAATATSFSVGATQISNCTITLSTTTYYYNGNAKKPIVTVMYGSKTLTSGVDYSFAYQNNIYAGTANVIVTGKDKYCGTKTVNFTIKGRSLSATSITVAPTSYVFDGKAKTPAVTVKDGSKTLKNGTDFTLAYRKNISIGDNTAEAVVTGINNYRGTVIKTFSITKRNIANCTVKFANDKTNYAYTGKKINPSFSVYDGSGCVAPGSEYIYTIANNINVGTATITITATNGIYTGTKTATFTIGAKSLSDCTLTLNDYSNNYSGSEIIPSVTVNDGNRTVAASDYTVSYTNNINAGNATVTVTGNGNYTGTIKKTFVITPKPITSESITITLEENQFEYSGSKKYPKFTVKDGDKILKAGEDYGPTYANNIDAGIATITFFGLRNYCGKCSLTYKINAKSISKASISLDQTDFEYNGSEKRAEVTVKDGSNTLEIDKDYTVSYKNNVNAGTATVTVIGKNNYKGSISKTYTINEKDINTASIHISSNALKYTGSEVKPAVIVTDGEKELKEGVDYTLKYLNNINVGTATCEITGKGNYKGTASSDFRILYEILKAGVTVKTKSVTYNGMAQQPGLTVKYGSKTLKKNIDYTVYYSNNINAGTGYAIVVGMGEYYGSISVPFTIEPKAITSCNVIFSPESMGYKNQVLFPDITVKDGAVTLKLYEDYEIEYTDTPYNAGKYPVQIIGKGNYKDTVVKDFEITKVSLANITNISLEKSWYMRIGAPRKPKVHAVNGPEGSIVLVEGTDYTLDYENSFGTGLAKVYVKGQGNYFGTVSLSYTISSVKPEIVLGTDNWSFSNTAYNFKGETYRDQMLPEDIEKLKSKLNNYEYESVFEPTYLGDTFLPGKINEKWNGSCYGMSVTMLLAQRGILKASDFDENATSIHDLDSRNGSPKIKSIINYYHLLYVKDCIYYNEDLFSRKTKKDKIDSILNLLDNNASVLLCLEHNPTEFAHAVLACGYESGEWEKHDTVYDRRILIYDPNTTRHSSYLDDSCLYFNSKTYEWEIPRYRYRKGSDTIGEMRICFACADEYVLNNSGYISNYTEDGNDTSIINAYSLSEDANVEKVKLNSEGQYVVYDSNSDNVERTRIPAFYGASESTQGYNLKDSNASYMVSQDKTDNMELSMTYENCKLSGVSKKGKSVVFDKNGYISVEGDPSEFYMSMTFNNDYPTDWFTIHVSGDNASNASLKKVDGGYILSADNLENISLKANNREAKATASFSTKNNSVFIYEINENTIGLKIDSDNNGTYETELPTDKNVTIKGDLNNDGIINISDATIIQYYLSKLTVLTESQLEAADINCDGTVNSNDVTDLQLLIAKKVS